MDYVPSLASRVFNQFSDLTKAPASPSEVSEAIMSGSEDPKQPGGDVGRVPGVNEGGATPSPTLLGESDHFSDETLTDNEQASSGERSDTEQSPHAEARLSMAEGHLDTEMEVANGDESVRLASGNKRVGSARRKPSNPRKRKVGDEVCDVSDPRAEPKSRVRGQGRRGAKSKSRDASEPDSVHDVPDSKSEHPLPEQAEGEGGESAPVTKKRKTAAASKAEASFDFIKGFVKTSRSFEKDKGVSLSALEAMIAKEKNPQLAFLLPLMLFIRKNTIVISKISTGGPSNKVSVITEEGRIMFESLYKKASPEQKAELDMVRERFCQSYWKIPKHDLPKIKDIIDRNLDCQIILNSLSVTSFPDRNNPDKSVTCIVPTFRYETALKK
jgi:hypothetical protein